jgi:hypothetical protein
LSSTAFSAIALAVLAFVLSVLTIIELRAGSCRGLLHDTVERGKRPGYFWIAWSLWALLAGYAWYATAGQVGKALRDPAPVPVAFATWAPWAVIALVVTALFAWMFQPIRWHRRGNRWTHRAEYRREKALRALLKQLTDDRLTGDEDETLDFLVDGSHIEWLEQLAINLAGQAPPRRLRVAIDATPEPPFEDDEEDDE